MVPSQLSPSTVSFALRSPSLPGAAWSSDQQRVGSSPLSPARLGAVAVRPGAGVPPLPPSLLAPQAGLSTTELPESLGLGNLSRPRSTAQSTAELPESLGLGTQLAQPEPARFFQERAADQVYVPPAEARVAGGFVRPTGAKPPLHPNRANVAGGLTGGSVRPIGAVRGGSARPIGAVRDGFVRPIGDVRDGFVAPIGAVTGGFAAPIGGADVALNRLTELTQTQGCLEEAILDAGSQILDLNARVFDVNQKTDETIGAQEQSMGETFKGLFKRVDSAEKRGAKVEAKRALLERKITNLDDKNRNLELQLGDKKEKLEKLKNQVERRGRILKYCSLGGLVLGASLLFFK